jgi:hypothetical protein
MNKSSINTVSIAMGLLPNLGFWDCVEVIRWMELPHIVPHTVLNEAYPGN